MPTAPFCFGDHGELIGDDVFLRGGLGVLEGFLQLGEFGGVLSDALAVLGVVGRIGDFDFGEGDLFGGIVRGADLGGALEGHVLEHVSEAAVSLRVVGRACVDESVEAEDGGFGAFADDEGQAVRQDFDGGAFFKACEVLRFCRANKGNRHRERLRQIYFLRAPRSSRSFSAKKLTIPKRAAGH